MAKRWYSDVLETFPAVNKDRMDRRVKGLAGLIEHLTRVVYLLSFSDGLFPTQWAALRYFRDYPNKSARDFQSFIGRSSDGQVSVTVNSLSKKGLLKSRPHPTDKRMRVISVTDKGEEALARDPILMLWKTLSDLNLTVNQTSDISQFIEEVIQGLLANIIRERQGREFDDPEAQDEESTA